MNSKFKNNDDFDINFLKKWCGNSERVADFLSLQLARRFAATFDLTAAVSRTGATAPAMIHHCLSPVAASTRALGQDGHPEKGGFLPPIPLPRRMWAGSKIHYHRDLSVGQQVERHSEISNVLLKQGRSGPLCFVEIKHQYYGAAGLAVEETQELVYREDERTKAGKASRPAEAQREARTLQRQMVFSPTLLFRYSALTFNAHRIHYDRSYAEKIEHYPGLVVQGALQATLLFQLAEELQGARPARFHFRAQAPAFDGEKIGLYADMKADHMELSTIKEGGPISVMAHAFWT